MSLLTTWGYTITDMDSLENMLDVDDFSTLTGGKYRGKDDQIEAEIGAACQAIRNYVGWHLYPSAICNMKTTFYDRRIAIVGRDILIQLPARFVTEIKSITIGGVSYETFVLDPIGILHVYDVRMCGLQRYNEIEITYAAGLTDNMMASIQELIAHRVTHSLAVPAGVTQESSGGVSVTYNANWINSARATALPDDNKEVLAPYRVQGVF